MKMKRMMLPLIVIMMLTSCTTYKRSNWTAAKCEQKREQGIKKGMNYNHSALKKEKSIKYTDLSK